MIYNIKDLPSHLMGIYKLTFPNNKIYIGQSNNIKRRMYEHKNKITRQPVSYAINKYGMPSELEVLEEFKEYDPKYWSEREKFFIQYYQSTNKDIGYNVLSGGPFTLVGINNPASKLTELQLQQIVTLLQENKMSQKDIAKLFGVSDSTINDINMGKTYYNPNLFYPIRELHYVLKGSETTNAKFDEQTLALLHKDLKDANISLNQLAIKYNCDKTVIYNINNGLTYFDDKIDYPIRKNKYKYCQRQFTPSQLDFIFNSLQDKSKTMEEIARVVDCDRKIIGEINKGKRYPREDIVYPIRK
jgi:group I intron endonuclease